MHREGEARDPPARTPGSSGGRRDRRSSSTGKGRSLPPMSSVPQPSPPPTHLLIGTPPEDAQDKDGGHRGGQGAGH